MFLEKKYFYKSIITYNSDISYIYCVIKAINKKNNFWRQM